MAYQIGQITKSSQNFSIKEAEGQLMEDYDTGYLNTTNPYASLDGVDKTDFKDFCIIKKTNTFSVSKSYYLRFQIRNIPQTFYSQLQKNDIYNDTTDSFNVKLVLTNNSQTDQTSSQDLGSFTVYTQTLDKKVKEEITLPDDNEQLVNTNKYFIPETAYTTYSIVFTPNENNYNTIKFQVGRVGIDVLRTSCPRNWLLPSANSEYINDLQNTNSDYGPIRSQSKEGKSYNIFKRYYSQKPILLAIQNNPSTSKEPVIIEDFYSLKNLKAENFPWTKLGYQGKPGDMIVINGQPIRVGRSGIYELDNGTAINSFMIAAPNGNPNLFILDYAYNTQVNEEG